MPTSKLTLGCPCIDRAAAERLGAVSGLELMQRLYPEMRRRGIQFVLLARRQHHGGAEFSQRLGEGFIHDRAGLVE